MRVYVYVCVWNLRCPKTSLGWLIPDAGRKGRWKNGILGNDRRGFGTVGRFYISLMDYKKLINFHFYF